MKFARRMVAAITIMLGCSAATQAQVMTQVPSGTLVVFHVKNPQEFSTKISGMMAHVGLPPMPPFNDLLGSLLTQIKATNGINKTGEMAECLVNDGKGMSGPQPPLVSLISTSDYAAFLGNYPDATTDGLISTIKLPDGPTIYSAHWGDFIALSPQKDLVSLAPGGITLTPAAAKEVDAHDLTVVVNMPAVRALASPFLAMGRAQVLTSAVQAMRQTPYAKFAPVFRVGFSEMFDFVNALLTQCDDVTLGLSVTDAGIGTTMMSDFKADSHYGQLIAQETDTDAPLLAGLPEAKYMAFGGEISNPKVDTQLFSDFLDPIVAELTKLGPEGQTAVDYIQSIEAIAAAQNGLTFGVFAPEGELGASPMLQFVTIRRGDAKALGEATAKMIQLQIAQAKSGGVAAQIPVQMTYTAAGKTVEGVSLDQMHVGFDMTKATTPEVARIGQILSFAYSTDGMNIYAGAINDATYIQMAGIPDDKMSPIILAAKSDDAPLAKRTGVVNTAAQLPKQRLATAYFPLDTVVNTVFGYMAKFGLDMGVSMPDTDPIGIAVSTDGSTARFDSYIPTDLVTNGMKVATKLMAPRGAAPGGPAGAPPAGGGL